MKEFTAEDGSKIWVNDLGDHFTESRAVASQMEETDTFREWYHGQSAELQVKREDHTYRVSSDEVMGWLRKWSTEVTLFLERTT